MVLPGLLKPSHAVSPVRAPALGDVRSQRDHGIDRPGPARILAGEGLKPDRTDAELLGFCLEYHPVVITGLRMINLA